MITLAAGTNQLDIRPEDSEIEVKHLKYGELAIIPSIWGHIAGGGANEIDTNWMNNRIATFLS